MKLLICCGGTGGHIYPGIAVAQAWQAQGNDCFFVGSDRLEKELVPKAGFRFIQIDSSPKDIIKIFKGIWQSFKIIRQENPDAVISTGGYVSFPILIAAWLMQKKIFLQEQNILPGKVNRYLAILAKKVFVSFELSEKYFHYKNTVCLGNPIRTELASLEWTPENNKVLIFGGSLSSKSINNAAGLIKKDPEFENVLIHLDGTNYAHSMGDIYKQALFVVCRAGATTLAEISAIGIPAVLIPYPFAAENHQEINARYFQDEGAAVMILDSDLTSELLGQTIKALIHDKPKVYAMAQKMKALGNKNAAKEICSEIIQTK